MCKHASESACGQLSVCSHILSCTDSSVTSIVEWSVDLLWHKHILHFHTNNIERSWTLARDDLQNIIYRVRYSPFSSIMHSWYVYMYLKMQWCWILSLSSPITTCCVNGYKSGPGQLTSYYVPLWVKSGMGQSHTKSLPCWICKRKQGLCALY